MHLVELAAAMEESAASNERDAVLDEAQRILDARADSESLSRAELHLQRAGALQYRDWQRSAGYARQAAALFERHNVPAKRAKALSVEAEAEYRTGNNEAAERGYQASLAIVQTLPLGRSHQLLPVVQMNLAKVQGQRLKIADADRNFREAIETAERIYGRDHDVYVKNIYLYGTVPRKVLTGTQSDSLAATGRRNGSTHEGRGRDLSEFNNAVGVGDSAGRSRIAGGRCADACTRGRAEQGGWCQRPRFCAGTSNGRESVD